MIFMITKPYGRIEAAVVILYETFQYEKITNLLPGKTKLTDTIIVNLIFFPYKFNHNHRKRKNHGERYILKSFKL